MEKENLLAQLQNLGTALDVSGESLDRGRNCPLEEGRKFLFTYLAQEPVIPYRAEDILELLAPSPHNHLSWEQERDLVLEGLALLRQVWEREPVER